MSTSIYLNRTASDEERNRALRYADEAITLYREYLAYGSDEDEAKWKVLNEIRESFDYDPTDEELEPIAEEGDLLIGGAEVPFA